MRRTNCVFLGARTNVKDSSGTSVEGILWGESAPSDKLNEKIKQTITKCKQQSTTDDLPDRKLYPSLTVELGLDPNRNHPTEGEEEIQGDDSPEATEEVVGTKSENAEGEWKCFATLGSVQKALELKTLILL